MKIGIVDYGGGNLRSVIRALEALGEKATLVSKPESLEDVSHVIFPGQGEFGDCARQLEERGLSQALIQWARADRPFFGICVGYQLLFESSEESPGVKGLSIFEGKVRHFAPTAKKVPHMGWNSASLSDSTNPYWDGLGEDPYFYFVHSYFPDHLPEEIVATRTHHGEAFVSAVSKGQVLGTQFHPEKSQKAGLKLIANFLKTTS